MDEGLDLEWIERKALESEDGEGYKVLDKGDGYRIGIVARVSEGITRFSMEFLFRMLCPEDKVDSASLKRLMMITKMLLKRGYHLTNQDDGWVFAERSIGPGEVFEEHRLLKGLTEC